MKYLPHAMLIVLLLLLGIAMYVNSHIIIEVCKPQDCVYGR